MLRSPCRLLRSQTRLFSTTTVTTVSPPLVWSSERVKNFDSFYKEHTDQKLGKYSNLVNSNYGYGHYCKLGLFRNVQIEEQQHNGLHQMVQLSSQQKRGTCEIIKL